ncbi:MAG: phosphatidylglycerophosphatase A [Bacilli bacterium]|jgi:phosphatidylglycerophosphatase A|nr:phosphatidylglycerophosphatase A [Bacilli bacterium]MCH4278359.1 phosphatidylglycerophosphatase A [Bacilli bacterium]
MEDYSEHCIKLLQSRGVSLEDIADCARYLQADYHVDLKSDELLASVRKVISKRETQYAIMTAIELDCMAEQNKMNDKELQSLLMHDDALYGVDEVLAYGICNTYGSIALTNFGYIDKKKYGVIDRLNKGGKNSGVCNTFIDDIVGAIAASAASRFAHRWNGDDNKEE